MPTRKGRSHHRGMLTTMVKYPKGGARQKSRSVLGTIGLWAAGIVVGAVLLVMLAALLTMMFNPQAGTRAGEGDFVVDAVEEHPPGYRAEDRIVAVAVVPIEQLRTRIPLTPETRAGIEKGKTLHVKYTYSPRMAQVIVQSWALKP